MVISTTKAEKIVMNSNQNEMTLGSDRAELVRLFSVSSCFWGRLIDDALLKDP